MRWGLSGLDMTKVQKINPFSPLPSLSDSTPSNNSFLFSADVEYFEVAMLSGTAGCSYSLCWCFYNSSLENRDFSHWLQWIRGGGWEGGGFSKLLQMVITAWDLHNFQKVKWHSAMLRLRLLINKLARDILYLLNHHWYLFTPTQLANYQLPTITGSRDQFPVEYKICFKVAVTGGRREWSN